MIPSSRTRLGFVAGLLLGVVDGIILRLLGVTMLIGDEDVTLISVGLYGLTFAVLCALIGRLSEQREELAQRAEVIAARGRELDEAREALVESETLAAVGRMAAGVAHEVRNPLSVIRSSAQLLAGSGDNAEAAEFIREEVDRLDDFVRRVLDFSRPLEAEVAEVSWKQLGERVQALAEAGIEPSDARLTIDLELTARLLAGLVENARITEGVERVTVRLDGLDILVEDDGPGVAEEVRERVFEPFVTTRAQGTGLGLAMARKLARVQGWELSLDASEPGRGAVFRLSPGGHSGALALEEAA